MDRRLETFLAVCQTMNYRRAAEALHLTQPAVTKQIQSLEASYGVRLFSYDGRKLRKTAPGSALEVFAISQRYQEQELERALHAAPRKILRVGATKTIGDYILPPAICSFVRAPEHELQFTVDNTTRLLGQLEAGQLDFVVVEGIFDKRRYDSFLLREEPYIGICAAGHRFAGRRVSLEELLTETLLLREPGSGTRSILERELMQVSYSTAAFSRTICISSFPVIRALTAANCGISFLYEAVVRGDRQLHLSPAHRTARAECRFPAAYRRRQPRPRIRRASHGACALTGRQKYRRRANDRYRPAALRRSGHRPLRIK